MPVVLSSVVLRTTRPAHLLERLHDVRLVRAPKNLSGRPWYVAAFVSWGIALFEYLLQVPANRIGYTQLSLAQLKILQEVITLGVFVPFAVFYMRQPLKLDFIWAGLCMVGAVYFMFRGGTRDTKPNRYLRVPGTAHSPNGARPRERTTRTAHDPNGAGPNGAGPRGQERQT